MVEPQDSHPTWSPFHMAALRESFEETGVLWVTPQPNVSLVELWNWRRRIHQFPQEFQKWLNSWNAKLLCDSWKEWANWVTPLVESKRFKTRFFLTVVPDEWDLDSTLSVDGSESVSMEWLAPKEALQAFKEKRIQLMPPQFIILTHLNSLSIKQLLEYSQGVIQRTEKELMEICPEWVATSGSITTLVLPGDYRHSTSKNGNDVNFILLNRDKNGRIQGLEWIQ